MPRTATDPLMLAAEEADAEAAAAEAEALAAQASAAAARARARAARLRREAGGSDEYEYPGSVTAADRAGAMGPAESDHEVAEFGAGATESGTATVESVAKRRLRVGSDPSGETSSGAERGRNGQSKTAAGSGADTDADVASEAEVDTTPSAAPDSETVANSRIEPGSETDPDSRAEPGGTELGSETSDPELSGAVAATTATAATIGRQGRIRQLPSRVAAVLAATARRLRPSRVRRPRLATVGRLLVVVVVLVSLAAGTYSIWNHRQLAADAARADEYLNAAREGVVALTTLDSAQAGADVQRILDHSTGAFRTDFQSRAEDFTTVVEQSQVATEGEITAAAVESTTDDSAVVLISAVSRVTDSAGAEQDPRVWRLSVTVSEGDSGLKMSKVEFVP